MICTDILMEEHQVILKRMEVLRHDLDNGFPENIDVIEKHCHFISTYADTFHHAKEEEIYFKWIAERNPSLQFGPILCMLGEHNSGRESVAKATDGIEKYRAGDESSLVNIKESLLSFINLIVDHISKEDEILYKMAESINDEYGGGDECMLPQFKKVVLPSSVSF
jgi:hemerythrin-like domain-containing protein